MAETPSGWCAVLRKSVQLSETRLTSSFHPRISGIKAGGSGAGVHWLAAALLAEQRLSEPLSVTLQH